MIICWILFGGELQRPFLKAKISTAREKKWEETMPQCPQGATHWANCEQTHYWKLNGCIPFYAHKQLFVRWYVYGAKWCPDLDFNFLHQICLAVWELKNAEYSNSIELIKIPQNDYKMLKRFFSSNGGGNLSLFYQIINTECLLSHTPMCTHQAANIALKCGKPQSNGQGLGAIFHVVLYSIFFFLILTFAVCDIQCYLSLHFIH